MSISIKAAKESYGGATEAETLENMAKATGSRRIYKYANDFGDKKSHTDYKRIPYPGHPQETAMFDSPYVHNVVLIYEDGAVTQEK